MKTIKIGIFTLSLVFLLTGCWDKVEIDDRNYVITMGIDKFKPENENFPSEENNNRFTITLGTAELDQTNGGGESSEEKESKNKGAKELSGETLASAMKLADLYSSRQTYFGQMKAVILGEELLKDKELFQEVLDTLERDQEINMKIIILGAKGRATDSVNAISGEKQPTGLFLWEFYKNNSKEVAATKKLDFETLLISLRDNTNAIIPLVGTKEEMLDLGGSFIIKDGVLIGELNEQQERGILLLSGDAEGAILNETYQNIAIPLRIIKNTSKVTFEAQDENIICNIVIHINTNLEGFSSNNQSILSKERLSEIETIFETAIEEETKESIRLLQKQYQVDAMDFSGMLKKKAYPIFKNHSGSDNAKFQVMDFHIQAKVSISGIGMIQ